MTRMYSSKHKRSWLHFSAVNHPKEHSMAYGFIDVHVHAIRHCIKFKATVYPSPPVLHGGEFKTQDQALSGFQPHLLDTHLLETRVGLHARQKKPWATACFGAHAFFQRVTCVCLLHCADIGHAKVWKGHSAAPGARDVCHPCTRQGRVRHSQTCSRARWVSAAP